MVDATIGVERYPQISTSINAIKTVVIRVRGTVQGVGFRPTVWRLARDIGLVGEVCNDAEGVLITLSDESSKIDEFLERLPKESPPLSHIEAIEVQQVSEAIAFDDFKIVASVKGESRTQVTPDAAVCPACYQEVLDPLERRYRYPLTNCTHCGPRLSIVKGVPYDRATTTMASFPMCDACREEYENPGDRRFHAQPIACHTCGPKVWLESWDESDGYRDQWAKLLSDTLPINTNLRNHDDIALAASLLQEGNIVAIRGLGGFHLACDATNEAAVQQLRSRKRRYGKPFALMARDLDVIRRYCSVSASEQQVLESPSAPIVLLNSDGPEALPNSVAPGLNLLGFMLPYTPLHVLLLQSLDRPLVMTSGNLSHEPQVIDNDDAKVKLRELADYVLFHNRDIANRVDDSVVRVMAETPRLMRRARGYAPSSVPLPPGFEQAPDLFAFGGELKSTFCVVKNGAAVLSQHQGDLEDVSTFEDYQKNRQLYTGLYDHQPQVLVCDRHPEYLSTKLAKESAAQSGLPLIEVQHHHAHIASCLAENNVPLTTPSVLGIALDGLGFGVDGTIWGGEFMLADYRGYQRLACLKPVAMIGGAQAIREPWRNTYAHLVSAFGWDALMAEWGDLDLVQYLGQKPYLTLNQMLKKGLNVPLASSCGRLFDAVSAAVGLCRDRALFEGQGAIELEVAVDHGLLGDDSQVYPFEIVPASNVEASDGQLLHLDAKPLWQALLRDLETEVSVSLMATRFHQGLAVAISSLVQRLATLEPTVEGEGERRFNTVALSGGCFQNKVLLEAVTRRVEAAGFTCLSQANVPANDGGLALGQAAIAAARHLSPHH